VVPEMAKRRSLETIAKQMLDAGLEITRFERFPDGKEVLVFRKPGDDGATDNPWDSVILEDAKKQKRVA
jgi:hypothetical protein